MASYPGALKTWVNKSDLVDFMTAAILNADVMDEIIAIETELGTDPAGAEATVVARLNSLDAHAARHQNGGADEISVAGLSGDLADEQDAKAHASSHQSGGGDAVKLDDLAAPDDNTDLNVSITAHGLCPKLDNTVTNFLNGQGGWTAPAGGAQIAHGTYSGNDTDDRQITTGFQCRLVVITEKSLAPEKMWVAINESGEDCVLHKDASTYHEDVVKPYLHASNGFTLGGDATTANNTGDDYRYVAFG